MHATRSTPLIIFNVHNSIYVAKATIMQLHIAIFFLSLLLR